MPAVLSPAPRVLIEAATPDTLARRARVQAACDRLYGYPRRSIMGDGTEPPEPHRFCAHWGAWSPNYSGALLAHPAPHAAKLAQAAELGAAGPLDAAELAELTSAEASAVELPADWSEPVAVPLPDPEPGPRP